MAVLLLAAPPGGLSAGDHPVSSDATQKLQASMAYVRSLEQFGLVTNSSIEAVLDSGQKIQFQTAAAVAVKRPNKLYAARIGELVDQEFFYDGKTLTLHDIDSGFYATMEAPDTLEGMLDFARDSLDIVAPAGDFIYSNAYEILMEDVESAFVVGDSIIEGVVCDHLAFSKPGTDFQVWVAKGDQPLPLKLVITSSDIKSAPQFSVLIREWDIVKEVPVEKFAFEQPDDAQAIEFIVLDPAGN
jgi:hypothetical protein